MAAKRTAKPPQASSQEDLLRRALVSIGGRGAVLVASFAFAIAAARILTPSSRGSFALLQSLDGFAIVAANFAIQGAIVHHVGQRRLDYRSATGAGLSLGLMSGLAALLVVTPVAVLLRHEVFESVDLGLVLLAIALATPLLIREYLGGSVIAAGRPLPYISSHALQPAGGLFLLLILAAGGSRSLTDVTLSWGFGIVLSATSLMIMSISLFGRPVASKRDLRVLTTFGLRTYPAVLARFLNLRLDQFLVAVLASHFALGIYAVAVNVSELLVQIPVALLWGVSGAIGSSNRETSQTIVEQFCRWSILILISTSIVIAVLVPWGLPMVFGSAYRDAVPVVFLLLPGMICYAPALIITEYFIIQRGLPSRALLISGTSIVIGVLGNLALTGGLGAIGAGIASSLAYGGMFVTAVILYTRATGGSALELLVVSPSDVRTLARVPSELLLRGSRRGDRRSPNPDDSDV